MNFTFRKYQPQDREQILHLMDNLWPFTAEEKEKYFHWKFEQNPYTQSPMGFVALDGNRIVSFRGCMVQPLIFKGESFLAATLGDSVTDPNYRRMGLLTNITKFLTSELNKDKEFKVCLNSSSGGPTYYGLLKLGWKPLAERTHLFSFSMSSFRNRVPIPVYPIELKRNGYTIIISKEIRTNEMAQLVSQHKSLDVISIDRDSQYFNWRFANPTASFIFAYFYENGQMKAYCCFKEFKKRKLDIIDYEFTKRKQFKLLLQAIHHMIAPRYILCWTVNPNDRIIQSPGYFGFINLNFILRFFDKFKKPPFSLGLTKTDKTEKDWFLYGKDMRDASTWNLNKAIADEI